MTEKQTDNSIDFDKDLAGGISKLTRKSVSINGVPKCPTALADARAQLDSVRRAREGHGSGLLERIKVRVGMAAETPNLDSQAEQLQALVTRLENEKFDGIYMTPLQEQEKYTVQASFMALKAFMMKELLKEAENDQQKSYRQEAEQAIDQACQMAFMSKWMAYSLKQKIGDKFKYYYPGHEIPNTVEPLVVQQLYFSYSQAFTLTEEELKK